MERSYEYNAWLEDTLAALIIFPFLNLLFLAMEEDMALLIQSLDLVLFQIAFLLQLSKGGGWPLILCLIIIKSDFSKDHLNLY